MKQDEARDRDAAANAAILHRLVADVECERYRLQALERRVVGQSRRRGREALRRPRPESRLDLLDRYIGLGDLCTGRVIRMTVLMREFGTTSQTPAVTAALFRQVPHLERFAPLAEAILGPARRRQPPTH